MKPAQDSVAMMVLERGVEWPSWGTAIRLRADHSIVEVQTDTETTETFCARVLARIEKLRLEGHALKAAGYACALMGEDRWQVRRELCLALIENLGPEEASELIVAGGAWKITGVEGRERSRLIELWSQVSQSAPGRLVSVRFEDPATESGVFRAVEKDAVRRKYPPT